MAWDFADALRIIRASGVVAIVICGHDHKGGYHIDGGVHHITLRSPLNDAESSAFGVLDVHDDRVELRGPALSGLLSRNLLSAAASTSAEEDDAEEGADKIPWIREGHAWLGRRVARHFGKRLAVGTVTKWARADGDDFALWHVVHDDGDEEASPAAATTTTPPPPPRRALRSARPSAAATRARAGRQDFEEHEMDAALALCASSLQCGSLSLFKLCEVRSEARCAPRLTSDGASERLSLPLLAPRGPIRVFLMRHGESQINAAGPGATFVDPKLTERGCLPFPSLPFPSLPLLFSLLGFSAHYVVAATGAIRRERGATPPAASACRWCSSRRCTAPSRRPPSRSSAWRTFGSRSARTRGRSSAARRRTHRAVWRASRRCSRRCREATVWRVSMPRR
jgi:hypothetical protein